MNFRTFQWLAFIGIVLAVGAAACINSDKEELIHTNEISIQGTELKIDPVIYQVNEDSLKVYPAIQSEIVSKRPKPIEFHKTNRIIAGSPRIVELASLDLKVLVPGEDTVPPPKVFTIPEPSSKTHVQQDSLGEFSMQHGYKVFAPCETPVRHLEPVKLQAMRRMENASLDLQYLDTEQGLFISDVFDILEDRRGRLWIGGYETGSYDGTYLYPFSHGSNPFPKSCITLFEDSKGILWMGDWTSIYAYDGHTTTKLSCVQSIITANCFEIIEDQKGCMWFGTSKGLIKYDGHQLTHYTSEQGLTHDHVLSLLADDNGNIWIGTRHGITKFDGRSFTQITDIEGFNLSTLDIIQRRNGDIWFGTFEGLWSYDGEFLTRYTMEEGLAMNSSCALMEDSDDLLWIGTCGGGLTCFDGHAFSHITLNEGLRNNVISDIIEDNCKNIWISSRGGGVMRFRKNSFQNLSPFKEKDIGRLLSIYEDRAGNMHFGVRDNGLYSLQGDSFVVTSGERSILQHTLSMAEDTVGNLWLGGFNEIVKYNREKLVQYSPAGISSSGMNNVKSLEIDKQGDLWLGTWSGGLFKFDGESFISFAGICADRPEMSLSDPSRQLRGQVTCMLLDQNGDLWYGHSGYGLLKYDGKHLFQFTEVSPHIFGGISCMCQDKDYNIWIGSNVNGVYKFDGKLFTHYPLKDASGKSKIRSIQGDANGNIWAGAQQGLYRFSPVENGTYYITFFGLEDGLKKTGFNPGAVCLDSRNRLWWGTGNNVTTLDLNTYENSSKIPVVSLVDMQINQRFIDFKNTRSREDILSLGLKGLKFSEVANFQSYPEELELPHNLNHLTFIFSAVDWSGPQQLKYQYRLEGMDSQWSLLSKESKADYRNIPPGNYLFRVKAVGGAGLWSEEFAYPFFIRRPWWASWFAFVLYGFIILFFARYYMKYIVKRERITAEYQIQQVEVEKMQELDTLKSRFFASISHEFRTPLTLILGPVNELLKKKDAQDERDFKLLKIMKRNAKRLQHLINQLLDISRLETGKMRVLASEGDLTSFVRAISNLFLSLAESKKISYQVELETQMESCAFDRDKTEKILSNLLSNAFKYTPQGGTVHLQLIYTYASEEPHPSDAIIQVNDTGKGIPEDQLTKVFDRFHQVDSSDRRVDDSLGIGLSLVKELVDLLKGTVKVESEVGAGSRFTVHLPVGRSNFSNGEWEEEPAAAMDIIDNDPIPVQPEATEDQGDTGVYVNNNGLPEVLIVEDNQDLRNYISEQLNLHYFTTVAMNGIKGLEIAYERLPDLIISDLMMPEMGGREMCSELKEDPRTSHIPVIMLTAKADKRSKLEGLETGADDYIIKPFDTEELQVRIKNLIQQREKLREKFRQEFILKSKGDIPMSPKDQLLQQILDIFEEHLADSEFSMDQLSGLLNLSRAQLFRKVQALTGFTPNDLFRKIRLKRAAELLNNGHDNISQVMYQVGFNNQSYFAKCFKEMFKMNPSEYVKAHASE